MSYLAGARFGAVIIPDPWQLVLISMIWMPLFVLAFILAREGENQQVIAGERLSREGA